MFNVFLSKFGIYKLHECVTVFKSSHKMASHLKGVAKSTLSDQIRKELCEYKRDNPASTQKDLQR